MKTLYDKLWDDHVVHAEPDGMVVLYIDRHLVHEVSSPQTFGSVKLSGRKPCRINSILAVRIRMFRPLAVVMVLVIRYHDCRPKP